MMRPTWRGLLLGLIAALPWLLLLPLGLLWLWQHGGFPVWLGATLAISLGAWLARNLWLRGDSLAKPRIEADPHWSRHDEAIWREIEASAAALRLEDYPLDARLPHRLLDLGLDTLRRVARHYHSEAREPELEVALPQVLRSAERVCRDLRRLTDHVPLSDRITLAQWKRAPGLMKLAQLYDLWRLARLALNPAAGLASEARSALQGRLFARSRDELMLWLLGEYLKGTGRHAIELYSGRLLLDRDTVTEALDTPAPGPEATPEEPFRLLVLGQPGSGKSSLVNALLGADRAPADPVAAGAGPAGYPLQRAGLPQAWLIDTAPDSDPATLDALLLQADLILLVCAAHQAARAADVDLLARVRARYRDHPAREAPPVLAVLSFIDRLRPPREWQPPYDWNRPDSPKAASIRAAVEALAATLSLAPARVVPVRTDPGQVYNVEQTLVPRLRDLLQDEAARARYLRCLEAHRAAERHGRWRSQLGNAGRLLWSASGQLGTRARQRLQDWLARGR